MDAEQRLADLERRVQAVEDVQAIERLKARYAELVDRRYHRGAVREAAEVQALAEEIGALFAEDAVWDAGGRLGRCEGRAAIAERMAEPTLLFSWHFFLKPQIEVDGSTATATWDLLSPCTMRDGRPHWMVGTERDAYRREGNVWLHTSMKLDVVFLAPHETGWEKIFA